MPLIAMDLRSNHDTGVARYGRSLLTAVCGPARSAGLELLVVVRAGAEEETRGLLAGAGCAGTHQVVGIPGDRGFVRDSSVLRNLLTARGADLCHSTHYLVDPVCPVPFVFTVHDLLRLRFPELTATDDGFVAEYGKKQLEVLRGGLGRSLGQPAGAGGVFARYFASATEALARSARHVVTVSETSAREVRELLPVRGDRLTVVPAAVATDVFRPRSRAEVDRVRSLHGLPGPYLVYVGLTHPGKRLPWLLGELTRARASLPDGTRLALVGGHAERDEEIRRTVHLLDATDFVRFTGRVTDDGLAALYTGAAACVSASVAEGSHLPSQEALACGCEVVAPDLPALRENAGRHAHLYPPGADGAPGALLGGLLAGSVTGRAAGYAPRLWRDSAETLVDCWERVLDGLRRGARCGTADGG